MRWISSFLAVAIVCAASQDSAAQMSERLMEKIEIMAANCGDAAQLDPCPPPPLYRIAKYAETDHATVGSGG